jgi:hypothetical protein
MSDDATPNESIKSVVDRMLPSVLADIEEQLKNGGTKSVRHACSACGHRDTIEVDTGQDAEMLAKVASMLASVQSRLGTKEDGVSDAIVKLVADRSAMTDAELAEYIAKLEAELAQ